MAGEMKIRHISPAGETKDYEIPSDGLSVGRSSTNSIAVPDEMLSRRHCMFEKRDDVVSVIDFSSANGTYLNAEMIDSDVVVPLKTGDEISAGSQKFKVLGPRFKGVDLGLGGSVADDGEKSAGEEPGKRKSALLKVLVPLLCAVVAATVFLALPESFFRAHKSQAVAPVKEIPQRVHSIQYEKVDATDKGIFRYYMYYDGFSEELSVRYDDMPVNNRKVRKGAKLSPQAVKQLNKICADATEFMSLGDDYSGSSASELNSLSFRRIRVVSGEKIKDVVVSNSQEPVEFRNFRETIETFSRNELGVWAIQYSREKLVELAQSQERVGDAKYEERDVHYGNLFAAVTAYREANFYLESVNPKPEGYDALVDKLSSAVKEHDKRYEEVRFLADKAINMQDWDSARSHLAVLCEIVPDKNDERNREAKAKLVDVEKRIKERDAR